ncbi:hypothetical protein AVEN_62461-1 [Araneus ventricosus]|uniref:Uncharacterized protein n=1 Tax=Araneus ventricosus TaxID=182803 RepID=A0A4Y2NRL8_ARAVE|nr:hypothetical protein AVEN_62461-1 [Araneus ventricosus]
MFLFFLEDVVKNFHNKKLNKLFYDLRDRANLPTQFTFLPGFILNTLFSHLKKRVLLDGSRERIGLLPLSVVAEWDSINPKSLSFKY